MGRSAMVGLKPYGPVMVFVTKDPAVAECDSIVFEWDALEGAGFLLGDVVPEFNTGDEDAEVRYAALPERCRIVQWPDRPFNGGTIMTADGRSIGFVESNDEIQVGFLVELLEEPLPGFTYLSKQYFN